MTETENVYQHEIDKFSSQAEYWWDPEGAFKTLHQVNPLRIKFIQEHTNLQGKRIVDVGCGGGILTESLAKHGAKAFGIDLSADLIEVARLHGLESGVKANYKKISAEALAQQEPKGFDQVTCMEMLEHVPDSYSIIRACATMVKVGGLVFFSTLNRLLKSYILAIVVAEYLCKMIPQGTHEYKKFIKPSELSQSARIAGLELINIIGVEYNPFTKRFNLGKDISVNYIAAFKRQK